MKKFSALLLSIALVFGLFLPQVSAAEKVNEETFLKQVKEVTKDTGLELVNASEISEGAPYIEFESIEQFEKAIKDNMRLKNDKNHLRQQERDILESQPIEGSNPSDVSKYIAAIGSITWNDYDLWWAPSVTMRININYDYYLISSGQKRFIGTSKINSFASGISSSGWVQTNSASIIIDGSRTIQISINGYHEFKVSIGGNATGFRYFKQYTKWFYYNS
ncbi:hypothetical protein [Bacillus sp. XF8]|uniref:hypothetical protein n=1 Tax=Bacillus sp. XF8 TaxID=2819289 RepID=UPI001AA03BF1|nr:hypothetical protein [Bacillus sp. XF8]MBO1583093.1 hypothetical protein [Bacillus sp. XF8]